MSEPIPKRNIYDEIEERWRLVYTDMHRDPSPRHGFSDLLQEAEIEARAKTTTALQPHLAIFEFGLEFLSYVHVALSSTDGPGPSNEDVRAPWALVGSAVSFGVSIRSLVISGLDTPARALLRTYAETLLLCIAILHDLTLGQAYVAADTDAKIKDFWHSVASPKRLHERIIGIEKKIGLDDETVDGMMKWRRNEYEVLSQSSHLSYLAAALTAVSLKLDDEDIFAPAIFGLASAHSPRTIFYAAATTWHFSRLSNPVLLGKEAAKCAIVLDKENDWHQRMVAARDTLSDMTLKHWPSQPGSLNHSDDYSEV
ncbi:conserved hypothetical protein [Mesorhizobium plurifarium]|uniref:Uncharacterized protein n=1 Tax=Mesorhizobium plurifarium TaxID=69974 RepID=A0A0K2VNB1_MESPL|nr:conserved hypothetical protein [Mesorhizobium plurifarium]